MPWKIWGSTWPQCVPQYAEQEAKPKPLSENSIAAGPPANLYVPQNCVASHGMSVFRSLLYGPKLVTQYSVGSF